LVKVPVYAITWEIPFFFLSYPNQHPFKGVTQACVFSVWDLRFLWWWRFKLRSSGLWCHVVLQ